MGEVKLCKLTTARRVVNVVIGQTELLWHFQLYDPVVLSRDSNVDRRQKTMKGLYCFEHDLSRQAGIYCAERYYID